MPPAPHQPESHAPASATPAETRTIDERSNFCFGCGPANPEGLHLAFTVEMLSNEATAAAIVTLTRVHEGPPGHVHGGIIATLFDEAMSKLNRPLDVLAMTRNMEVDFLRPAPLGTPLTLTARHLRREGRKLFHTASLTHPDGTLLASARGLFLVIDPSHLAALAQAPGS